MFICPECRSSSHLVQENFCENCGWNLKHINEVPVYLSNGDLNSEEFNSYIENYKKMSENNLASSEAYGSYLSVQNNKLGTYCQNITSDMSVCEVGVGRGYLLQKLLNMKPKKVVGIDISLTYLNRLQKTLVNDGSQLELVMANAENIPYKNEFDYMIASDILEHVLNPGNFVFCVNQALKKGGTFMVRVPCNESLISYSRFMGCDFKYAHLRNFNKKSLSVFLSNSGFKLVKTRYDGYISSNKRAFIRKSKLLSKFFDWLSTKYTNEHSVLVLPNMIARIFMRPIEITMTFEKVKDLIPPGMIPKVKQVEKQNHLTIISWEYEAYQINSGFEFIVNISDTDGKTYSSQNVGDTLSCQLDLSYLSDGKSYKINVYVNYEGQLISQASKDYVFHNERECAEV